MTDVTPIPEPEFATPEARTMWLFDTDAEFRARIAFNYWLSENDLRETRVNGNRWRRLSAVVREEWEGKAREHLAAYHKSGPATRRLQNRNAMMQTLARNDRASGGQP